MLSSEAKHEANPVIMKSIYRITKISILIETKIVDKIQGLHFIENKHMAICLHDYLTKKNFGFQGIRSVCIENSKSLLSNHASMHQFSYWFRC